MINFFGQSIVSPVGILQQKHLCTIVQSAGEVVLPHLQTDCAQEPHFLGFPPQANQMFLLGGSVTLTQVTRVGAKEKNLLD